MNLITFKLVSFRHKIKNICTCKELLSTSCPFSLRTFLAFSPKSWWCLKPWIHSLLWLAAKSWRWQSFPQYSAILQNEHFFNFLFFFINCSTSSLQLKQNRLSSKLIFLARKRPWSFFSGWNKDTILVSLIFFQIKISNTH